MRNASTLTTLLLLSLASLTHAQTIGEDSAIFSCADIITELNFNFVYFERYDEFFRDDSLMILAQAGTYQGVEAIREYVGFTRASASPYFVSEEISDYSVHFKGFDAASGLCEVMSFHRMDYVWNESTTAYAAEVGVTFMAKILYNPSLNYIPQINVYYAEPYLEFFFGTMLKSPQTTQFLCQDVLQQTCGGNWPTCEERLDSLPALTDEGYVDGNCVGCRALHGAFALTNPTNHCPHVSLTAAEDPKGAIKCQKSLNISVSDLFSEQDLQMYLVKSAEFQINGSIGYVENEPYYRTFRRIYEDTLLRTPPISGLLQTLVFPGVAADALTLGENSHTCPAFQNDTQYWTDFAQIELSETHLDYVQPRRLAGDVLFGPGTCTVSHVGYTSIRKRLAEMPRRLVKGTAYRTNELGKNRLNTKTFADDIWSQGYIGTVLGVPNQDHSTIRPVWDALFGDDNNHQGVFGDMLMDSGNRWSYSQLVESAKTFLSDKNRIHSGKDPSLWVLGMLQQIALNEQDNQANLEAFLNLRDMAVFISFLPEQSVEKLGASLGVDIGLGVLWKRGTASNYQEILESSPVLAEVRELIGDDPEALTKASWAILDAFLFAGGLSVPHSILHAMASYYDGFEGKEDLNVKDATDLKLLVMETIRRYPPVSSVPIMDARDHHRTLAFVSAAGYDESVYGENVKDFRIRGDLQWYHERSLAFAEPGLPINEGSPETARICPGRSLAVAMAAAWLEAIDLQQWCVSAYNPLKRIPLEFGNYELVRKGTEGANCWENNTLADTSDSGESESAPQTGLILGAGLLLGFGLAFGIMGLLRCRGMDPCRRRREKRVRRLQEQPISAS